MAIVIAIVGPTQSGSTMLFNLVQFILDYHSKTYDTLWIANYNHETYVIATDYVIIKAHEYDDMLKNIASIIILPLRDPRDCYISHNIRFPHVYCNEYTYISNIHQNMKFFNDWQPYATIVVIYEEFKQSPINNIISIAKMIGFVIDTNIANDIDRKINGLFEQDIPVVDEFENAVYRKTLLSKSHNTSGGAIGKYKHILSLDVRDTILADEAIHYFLVQHGYEKN